jgi:hypothetical protein
MKDYKCRDCGLLFTPEKPTNRCPECGSLYLIPSDFKPGRRETSAPSLSDRLSSLLLGAIFGLLTFVGWLLALWLHGVGPRMDKAFFGIAYFGVKLSLLLALVSALIGLLMGSDRLVQFFGLLWGTDRKLEQRLNRLMRRLPNWFWLLALLGVTLGAMGYLMAVI